jgi:hypothetical protein
MVAVRVYFQGERIGPKLERAYKTVGSNMLSAARGAAQDVSQEILKLGRSDISSAGHYGTRWTRGLHAPVTEGGGNIRVGVTHDIPYFRAPLYGATIKGRPWLYFKPTPGFVPGNPKLIRKRRVFLPKKFHTVEIARNTARRMPEFYRARFTAQRS